MSGDAVVLAGSLRGSRTVAAPFALLFIIAGILTAVIVWLASSGRVSGEDISGPLRVVITAIIVNGGLIITLSGLVVWRILSVMRSRDAGARLNLRYMSLFAFAAAAPAVIVAFFFGVLVTRGVDGWFSERMETVVNNTPVLAEMLMGEQDKVLQPRLDAANADLNRYIGEFRRSPEAYERLLQQLLSARDFRAIRIINRQGEVLAEAMAPGSAPYIPPAASSFVEADSGESAPAALDPETDIAHILLPLGGSPRVYAFIQAPMPPGVIALVEESRVAVRQYRQINEARGTVQAIFMSIYLETALLVLLGALWLGMTAATSISQPVARLIDASNRVASGDLRARVPTDFAIEEINALSRSFNQMTDDLKRQTGALQTARAEAEDRRQFIETVLSGVSAGVLGLDADGRISVCNGQAARLLGGEESGLRGRLLEEVAPELVDVAGRGAEAGGAEEEIDVLRKGENRRLRVRAGGSAKDGVVMTFDDITRLVSAQRNAAWRDVARRIAHEIKNPLTPIQLSAERLRRKYRKDITGDVETFDRCTDTIIRQVGDIGRMVDEFSAFARMPAPRFTACDAGELLREAVFARRVANPDIDILIDDQIGENGGLLCDERMISQALTNILKNAAEAVGARAHSESGFQGRILARSRREGANLIFEVEDNGVGLPMTDRDRLTEPYVTTREKGTGLGLAIVRRILEDHGGSLVLKDADNGRGALVSLIIPQGAVSRPESSTKTVPAQG